VCSSLWLLLLLLLLRWLGPLVFPLCFVFPLLLFSLTKLKLRKHSGNDEQNSTHSVDGGETKTNQAPQRGRQAAPHQARGGLVETQKKRRINRKEKEEKGKRGERALHPLFAFRSPSGTNH